MTVHEAIAEIRRAGTIRAENGKLKLAFPEPERGRLAPAIEVLRRDPEAVMQALARPETDSTWTRCTSAKKSAAGRADIQHIPKAAAPSLKGQAVELWRDGRRFFLVADDEDALEAMRRFGAHRGEVWTSGELELVASIPDQATRDEVESLKRQMDSCVSTGAAGQCVSAAEWQAQMLNQLFQEQGVTGQPGKITAATVKHGEQGELR